MMCDPEVLPRPLQNLEYNISYEHYLKYVKGFFYGIGQQTSRQITWWLPNCNQLLPMNTHNTREGSTIIFLYINKMTIVVYKR